jgi:hypothetical protein
MPLSPTYADLEIRIYKKESNGYPVEMTLNHEQQYSGGYLDPVFLPWLASASPEKDGQRLYNWLFADRKLAEDWARIRGQSPQLRLRLRIAANAPELHQIPWELLRDTREGVAYHLAALAATPFSRYLAGKWRPGSPILKRPIRILVAIAAPEDLGEYGFDPDKDRIRPDEEWDLLQQAAAGIDNLTLELLPQPCTLSTIEAKLQEGFHILHLVSHGTFIDEKQDSEALLYLANPDNRVDLVNQTAFATMLANQLADVSTQRDDKLQLVFLSSCRTASRTSADAFRGFSPALVAAGVPAVVAMQNNVPVDTARAFAQTFYKQLLRHGLVDLAGNEARAATITADLPGTAIPVIFMRLPNGQLLGQRGQISGDRQEDFWPILMENIERGTCIPFLGPRVNQGLLPSPNTIARWLAIKYDYPLADSHDLAKVAQFIGLNDPAVLRYEYIRLLRRSLFTYLDLKPSREDWQRYKDANFSDTATGLQWAEKVLAVQGNEIYHLLADLPLPLYLTTNMDSFMTEALHHKGRAPRRMGLRWQKVEAGTPQFTLPQDLRVDQPLVLHLNGYDADPVQQANLVLSEESYLEHFVRLTCEQDYILPAQVNTALSQSSFLFLGYDLNDWEFRVVVQGLIRTVEKRRKDKESKLHVGVQLERNPDLDSNKVLSYLRRYLLKRFNIEIYWGTPQQFMAELYSEWQAHYSRYGSNQVEEEEWEDDDW